MIRIEQIASEFDLSSGRKELLEFAHEAKSFLNQHKWCRNVVHGYLALAWPPALAVFQFQIDPDETADDTLWVVVGDFPPAYIDTLHTKSAKEALEAYCYAMQEWVDAVLNGKSIAELIPVYKRGSFEQVPPTFDMAHELDSRLRFIRERILPRIE